MLTHEHDPNASNGTSPPQDNENSGSSADKGKGSWRHTHQFIIKRSIKKDAASAAHSQNDNMDDFVVPRPHAKKHSSPKASKEGGGRKKVL
jgi:hypothetical protein